MKFQKDKLIISGLIFLVGLWMNVYFSTNLHFLLIRKMDVLSLISFKTCIISIATSHMHLSLFLCLQGFISLFAVFYYVANHKPYQSDLVEITPQISTPVAAGQKQFGSAQWLSDEDKKSAFDKVCLDSFDESFYPILDANKEEIERMNHPEKNTCNEKAIDETDLKTKAITASESLETKISSEAKILPNIKSGGVVIGYEKTGYLERIYYIADDTHTLCIGATRSGKTRSVVLQTIGMIGLAGEGMILSDPKGELYTYTYPFLESLGYEVVCIDFKNPLKSQRYNFLQPVIDALDKNDIPKAVDATWDLTASLVPENSHNEKIWTNGEASIIASAIMSVVYDNRNGNDRRYQNMSNVYFFISEMCKTIDGTMPIIKYMKTLPSSHPSKALLSISEVAPSKTRGSFYTSALTTLRLFTNPLIHSMTERSDFNMETIGEAKQAIFIILPDEKSTYYSLASLFVNQSYLQLVKNADQRGGRLRRRVNYMLEEFGNFVKIPDFATKLTVGGGRGIRFNLFIQSLMQLDEKYGKESAGTIKSNCETWIYLQADDLNTLEEISKKLGNYTVSTYSLSSSHGKYTTPSSSHSINLTHRALLTIDEVRLLSRPYSLITSRNHPAIMIANDLSKWFFNRLFGLGDKGHNRKIRECRETTRVERPSVNTIDTWNVWEYFIEEGRNKNRNTRY